MQDGAQILMAIDNPMVRQGLQNALQQSGFGRAYEAADLDKAEKALQGGRFDMIIAVSEIGSEPLYPLLRRLRQGDLPHHPFPIVVLLAMNTERKHIGALIDSGPDAMLPMPVSPLLMVQRITALTEKRKPFVITSDYVGPDRRSEPRPGAAQAPMIEAPNPLLKGQNPDRLQEAIENAAAELKKIRLERYAFELRWLSKAVRTLFDQEARDESRLEMCCQRIKVLLEALVDAAPAQAATRISTTARHLDIATGILNRDGFAADPAVLNGMAGLSGTLHQLVAAA